MFGKLYALRRAAPPRTEPRRSNVRRPFRRLGKDAGLGRSFPYELRHTLTSHLIDGGSSVEEVADLLGNDPRTLYRHCVRASVDVAVGPSEQLFGRALEADAT